MKYQSGLSNAKNIEVLALRLRNVLDSLILENKKLVRLYMWQTNSRQSYGA